MSGRVAIVETYPHLFAGAHRVTESLLRELPATGWHGVVVLPAEGAAAEGFRAAGLDVVVVPAPPALLRFERVSTRGLGAARAAVALPAWWLRLARVLRDVDVVHALDPRGILLAGPAARLARRPVVWQLHATSQWPSVNRVGSRLAREVVAVSTSSRDAMAGLRGPVAVEEPPLADAVRHRRPAVAGAEPLVATVARLHHDKGLDVLVDALAALSGRWPTLRARVVGARLEDGGEAAGEVGARLAAGGIGHVVTFTGWVPDPAREWGPAWVYVQPSRPGTESYGVAVVEAMAAGVPVVVTDVAGLRERVVDGETGLVVPPEDPAALAAAVERLLADRDLAAHLGAAGRASVLSAPTPAASAASWAARYSRIGSPRANW